MLYATSTRHTDELGLPLESLLKCWFKVCNNLISWVSTASPRLERDTKIGLDSCYFFDDLSVYEGFGGVVLAKEEGVHIGEALGPKNKSIILQNHGYKSSKPSYMLCRLTSIQATYMWRNHG